MRARAVLVSSALLVSGAVAGFSTQAEAKAKPKPTCNNVVDAAGDVGLYGGTPVTPDDALDLRSADLAGSAKGVTVAIRVTKLASPASTSPAAAVYDFRFTHAKSDLTYTLWATVTGGQATYGVGTVDTSAQAEIAESTGKATGVFDTAKNEVRIFAPYSALGGARLGVKATIDTVVVKRGAPTHYYGRYADDAAGGKGQNLGTLTCVKLGG